MHMEHISSSSTTRPDLYPSNFETEPKPFFFFHHYLSSYSNQGAQTDHGPIRTVAACGGYIYAGSDTGTIRVWRLQLPDHDHQLSHECEEIMRSNDHKLRTLAVSGDRRRVFAACDDGKIRVWCRPSEMLPKHVHSGTVPKLRDYLRSYVGGKDLKREMNHLAGVTSLAIDGSDGLLYSASLDSTVTIWRIPDFRCIEKIRAHAGPVNAIILGEDGILYTGSDDATVKVWRRITYGGDQQLSLIVTLPTKDSPAKALALGPDDGVLYVGCTDGYVYYWAKQALSGQMKYTGALLGHSHAIICLACKSNYVASGSADWTCRVWVRDAVGLHMCLAVLDGNHGPITGVALLSIGATDDDEDRFTAVCTGSVDGALKVWRVTNFTNAGPGP